MAVHVVGLEYINKTNTRLEVKLRCDSFGDYADTAECHKVALAAASQYMTNPMLVGQPEKRPELSGIDGPAPGIISGDQVKDIVPYVVVTFQAGTQLGMSLSYPGR
jgi:hypothetical protein